MNGRGNPSRRERFCMWLGGVTWDEFMELSEKVDKSMSYDEFKMFEDKLITMLESVTRFVEKQDLLNRLLCEKLCIDRSVEMKNFEKRNVNGGAYQ